MCVHRIERYTFALRFHARMLPPCATWVSAFFGTTAGLARTGISSVNNNGCEFLRHHGRPPLFLAPFLRDFNVSEVLLTRKRSVNTAFCTELTEERKEPHILLVFCDAYLPRVARTLHLCRRSNSRRYSFCPVSSSSLPVSKGKSSHLENTKHSNPKHRFSTIDCFCVSRFTTWKPFSDSKQLDRSRNASISAGTAASGQLYPRHVFIRALRRPSWGEIRLCHQPSGGSLLLSFWRSTSFHCTPTKSRQPYAYSPCTLGNTYSKATVRVDSVPTSEPLTTPVDKTELDDFQAAEILPTSKISSSSTFSHAAPRDTDYLSERALITRSPWYVCFATSAAYSPLQTRCASSTRKSASSLPPHQKQEDLLSFFPSEIPENLSWNWWDLYIRGINPDYPPRQRMFAYLTSEGICVKEMEINEVEEFTKYLEMRRVYGDKFPVFPYDIKFEDKLDDLRQKYPLEGGKAKKAKKVHD